jgi:signal transduction histidine kinase
MLMFSKNRQPLLEHVNINHVLTECIELMTGRADEKGIAVLSDLEDLPPIPADIGGLQQAFVNLLTNAIDAVSEQTGVITVSSRFHQRHKSVIVSVVDNGSGVPEDKLDQIFTPFFSVKGQQGTGLGLAVAQKVVKEHQGRIEVASKLGEGTTFTVTLPAVHVGKSEDTNAPTR